MTNRIKKFLSYYQPYRGLLCADILCAMLVAAASLALPLLIRYITKDILQTGLADALPHILRTGAAMLVLIFLQTGGMYFYDYYGHAMGAMMERDMRTELFGHLQRLSFSFHDQQRPGQLMSRMTNDLLSLAELYHHGPENLAIYSIQFIGAIVVLFRINAALTGAALLFLPPVAVFTLVLGRRMFRATRENLAQIGGLNATLEENLSGIRVVQSFGNEDYEAEKFAHENEKYLHSRKTIYRNEAVFSTGIETFSQLLSTLIVVLGGLWIVRGQLDLADLLTFLLYISYLVRPITTLAFTINQYQQGLAGFSRFMDILETTPEITDAIDAVPLPIAQGDIRFEQVSFQYAPDQPFVLSAISLHIAPGETVAVVGHSGIGKTTLCSLIPRFYDVTEGRILLDGHDIRCITRASLRQHIGVMQQEVYLFSGTVLENIRYGKPGASREEVIAASELADAHSFIMDLPQGYETQIGHRGIKLSGGQRQRLSIARTFLKNPSVLILDEATSALDTESERVIQASLQRLSKGRTTLIIAHRLTTIQAADRIVVLSDHGIAEEGTHSDLLALGGVYAQLY